MNADEFADATRSGCACIGGGFDSRDIAAHNRRHESRADLLVANERDIGGFDHRVRRLNHRHQTFRLNHSECFLHSICSL
jgi:hypothetical protein